MSSGEDKFKPGDPVFAKVRGYPPWPATVTHRIPGKSEMYAVLFYGTYESVRVGKGSIYPYDEDTKLTLGNVEGKGSTFAFAMKEIEYDGDIAEPQHETQMTGIDKEVTTPIVTTDSMEDPTIVDEVPIEEVHLALEEPEAEAVPPSPPPVAAESGSGAEPSKEEGPSPMNASSSQPPALPPKLARRSSRKSKPRKRYADGQGQFWLQPGPEAFIEQGDKMEPIPLPPEERPKLVPVKITAKRKPRKNSTAAITLEEKVSAPRRPLRPPPPLLPITAHSLALTSSSGSSIMSEVSCESVETSMESSDAMDRESGKLEERMGLLHLERPNPEFKSKDANDEAAESSNLQEANLSVYDFEAGKDSDDALHGPSKRKRMKIMSKGSRMSPGTFSIRKAEAETEKGILAKWKLHELEKKLVQLTNEGEIVGIIGALLGYLGKESASCDQALELLTRLELRTDITTFPLYRNPEVLEVILKVKNFHGNNSHWANLTPEEIESFHTKAQLIRDKAFSISRKFKLLYFDNQESFHHESRDDELETVKDDSAATATGFEKSGDEAAPVPNE